jgi:SAM-dependent methyltransferase
MNHPRCEDFHFARIFRGDLLPTAIARHEHYLMARLGLKPGMRVLNVGCGTGSAAFELANFANVNVVGVDNEYHKVRNQNFQGVERQDPYCCRRSSVLSRLLDSQTCLTVYRSYMVR